MHFGVCSAPLLTKKVTQSTETLTKNGQGFDLGLGERESLTPIHKYGHIQKAAADYNPQLPSCRDKKLTVCRDEGKDDKSALKYDVLHTIIKRACQTTTTFCHITRHEDSMNERC